MSIHEMSEDKLRWIDSLLDYNPENIKSNEVVWNALDNRYYLKKKTKNHTSYSPIEISAIDVIERGIKVNIKEEAEDAIFKDKQQRVENALTIIPRHPLMKDRSLNHLEEKIEEYKLDLQLGLKGQAANAEKQIIDKDIDEVMRGEKYYSITLNQLEKLFNFPKLKWKTRWFNYLKCWTKKPVVMVFAHLLSAIPVVVTLLTTFINSHFAIGYMLCLLDVFLIICFAELKGANVIKLEMSTDDVKRTRLNIPMGAKLRLKEAMERKLFDKIIIAYPNIVVNRNIEYDPAIIGVTNIGNEEKWWMITYWDVKKDEEKTNSQIEHFRRLKLRSYE